MRHRERCRAEIFAAASGVGIGHRWASELKNARRGVATSALGGYD
jgi:hypothetical protein